MPWVTTERLILTAALLESYWHFLENSSFDISFLLWKQLGKVAKRFSRHLCYSTLKSLKPRRWNSFYFCEKHSRAFFYPSCHACFQVFPRLSAYPATAVPQQSHQERSLCMLNCTSRQSGKALKELVMSLQDELAASMLSIVLHVLICYSKNRFKCFE